MPKLYAIPLLALMLLASACDRSAGGDRYLDSLRLAGERISPSDSISLDEFGLNRPSAIVKNGDWLVVYDSSGDKYLWLFNEKDSTSFRLVNKGRGPGEMPMGGDLFMAGGKVLMYDNGSSTCVALDVAASANAGKAVFDTLGRVKAAAPSVIRCGDGYISADLTRKDVWYVYRDASGIVKSHVPVPDYPQAMESSFFPSFITAARYAISPDGKNVCCAMSSASAVSFASVDDGILTEKARYIFDSPSLHTIGDMTMLAPEDAKSRFVSASASGEHVFLLYSGRPMTGEETPGYEADKLVVYGWDGNAERLYQLSRTALSVFVDNGVAYCLSTYPKPMIYVYSLS